MDSAKVSRRPAATMAVAAILSASLLLALYIGSSAPAFGLVFTGDMRRDRFDAIYAPLEFLAERSPPIKRGLHAYWEWWLRSFGYYPAGAQAASGDARELLIRRAAAPSGGLATIALPAPGTVGCRRLTTFKSNLEGPRACCVTC